jgi:acetyl esterase/lipase
MGNVLINIFGIFLVLVLICFLWFRFHPTAFDQKLGEQVKKARQAFVKKDADLLGRRMLVPRENADGVHVNLYIPSQRVSDPLPVVFVAHGGQFMDGDADALDSFCDRVKDTFDSIIVNINYTTIDVKQIPYPQEEIRDTVLYFAVHATEFNMDPKRFCFLGFSAGAYLEVGAAAFLKEKGFRMCGQVSVHPFVDDTMIRLADAGAHISPFTLISAGNDSMRERYPVYAEHLKNAGVDLTEREYPDAMQGFIEYNNPEYENIQIYHRTQAISEDQKDLARACEIYISGELERFIQQQN